MSTFENLDAVKLKHGYTCKHFEGLSLCPVCDEPLEKRTAIIFAKKLEHGNKQTAKKETSESELVESDTWSEKSYVFPLKEKNKKKKVITHKKGTPDESITENTKTDGQLYVEHLDTRSKKSSVFKLNKENRVISKESVTPEIVNQSKSDKKSNSDVNMSVMPNVSSKMNKLAEKRNNKGETALHIACKFGTVEKVIELLNHGANPYTTDNAGWTSLHKVVRNNRLDMVKLLLKYTTLMDVPGPNGMTPLHEAIRYGHKEIVEELVMHGADTKAQNDIGETLSELAAGEMEEVLNNAEKYFGDFTVYCSSQYRTVLEKLWILAHNHSNITIAQKLNKNVTHLIVDAEDGVCQSSVHVLQGIVSSIWILSTDWIKKSTTDTLEPFEKYEITGVGTSTNKGPKNSRYNKYKQHPGIFDGCYFYLHNFKTTYKIKSMDLTKKKLNKLIINAGGVVLQKALTPKSISGSEKRMPYHANKDGNWVNYSHFIIFQDTYEPVCNMQHIKALPIGWLIQCIEKYELCEPWF